MTKSERNFQLIRDDESSGLLSDSAVTPLRVPSKLNIAVEVLSNSLPSNLSKLDSRIDSVPFDRDQESSSKVEEKSIRMLQRVDSDEFIADLAIGQYDYEKSGSQQSQTQQSSLIKSSRQELRSIMESNLADELMQLHQDGNMFGGQAEEEIYDANDLEDMRNFNDDRKRESLIYEEMIKKLDREQGIDMSQSYRSQTRYGMSKQSQSQQSQSQVELNRSIRTQSKKVILNQIGEINQECEEMRADQMSRETSKQFDLGSQGNSELPFNKMLDELLITSPVSIKHAQTQAHSLDKQHRDKKQDSNLGNPKHSDKVFTIEQLMKKSLLGQASKSPSNSQKDSSPPDQDMQAVANYDESRRKTVNIDDGGDLDAMLKVEEIRISPFENDDQEPNTARFDEDTGEANDDLEGKEVGVEIQDVDDRAYSSLKQKQLLFEKSAQKPSSLIQLHLCDPLSSRQSKSQKSSTEPSVQLSKEEPPASIQQSKQRETKEKPTEKPIAKKSKFDVSKVMKFLQRQQKAKEKPLADSKVELTNQEQSVKIDQQAQLKDLHTDEQKEDEEKEDEMKKKPVAETIPNKKKAVRKKPTQRVTNQQMSSTSPFIAKIDAKVKQYSEYSEQFKLSDTYREKLRQKRAQQTAKERKVCTFKPDLSLTRKHLRKKSTTAETTKRLAQGNYMSSPVKRQESEIQKLERNLRQTLAQTNCSMSNPSLLAESNTEYTDPLLKDSRSMNELPLVRRAIQNSRSSSRESLQGSINDTILHSVQDAIMLAQKTLEPKHLKRRNHRKSAAFQQQPMAQKPSHQYSQSFESPLRRPSTMQQISTNERKERRIRNLSCMQQQIQGLIERHHKEEVFETPIEEHKKEVIVPETVAPTPSFPTEASKANSGQNSQRNEKEEQPQKIVHLRSATDVLARMTQQQEDFKSKMWQRPEKARGKETLAKESWKTRPSAVADKESAVQARLKPASRNPSAPKAGRTGSEASSKRVSQPEANQRRSMRVSQASLTQRRWNVRTGANAQTQRERQRSGTPILPSFVPRGSDPTESLLLAAQKPEAKVADRRQAYQFLAARLHLHELLHSDQLSLDL